MFYSEKYCKQFFATFLGSVHTDLLAKTFELASHRILLRVANGPLGSVRTELLQIALALGKNTPFLRWPLTPILSLRDQCEWP